MHDSDRPRRPVPAWVTAPFVDGAVGPVDGAAGSVDGAVGSVDTSGTGLEARPTPVPSAPGPETIESRAPRVTPGSVPTPGSAPGPAAQHALDPDAVVPDYPPTEALLPPAPMSPVVHTTPFDRVTGASAPAPVSPVDAPALVAAAASAPAPVPAPSGPVVPRAGQPRFSVPGLEHVVVEGTEPEPTGPVGYRTPARFAHQQGLVPPTPAPAPAPSFDAVLAAPPTTATRALPTQPEADATAPAEADPSLSPPARPARRWRVGPGPAAWAQTAAPAPSAPARRALGATPGGVLGAVAALATLGLAAWWFTAPGTVHAVGLALGVIALVCSFATLRNRAATWQRLVALLGAVLGTVGTLVLLWAVASAALPMAGVTLPDLTGAGVVPTLAP
ncbi:hypothetical protein [Curtobacterium sp. PhB130]|uniref:hypothetical protein n=1 Tax=Curtobacterium sp. PhB130 TaxID=2485178 RepID=UPI000F4B9142|nr:hypothetical protein [Curtobacterium sp. PhB130]